MPVTARKLLERHNIYLDLCEYACFNSKVQLEIAVAVGETLKVQRDYLTEIPKWQSDNSEGKLLLFHNCDALVTIIHT